VIDYDEGGVKNCVTSGQIRSVLESKVGEGGRRTSLALNVSKSAIVYY
jgi:hypothetical protein